MEIKLCISENVFEGFNLMSLSKATILILLFVVAIALYFEEDNLEGWPIKSTSCPDVSCSDH
jgi:hypothetical protein